MFVKLRMNTKSSISARPFEQLDSGCMTLVKSSVGVSNNPGIMGDIKTNSIH